MLPKVAGFASLGASGIQIFEEPPDHGCVKNHEGSSGGMEPIAVLEMHRKLYTDNHTIIDVLITDDDSSIKAKLKWSNEDHMANNNTTETPTIINRKGNVVDRPNHGRFPAHMPELSFAADPNHRKKTVKGVLCKFAAQKVADRATVTKMDCIRISTNFAYFIRTLPRLDKSKWMNASKAALDHHFDTHDNCGEFCKRETQTPVEREATRKYYRSMEKDKKLYVELESRLARFVTAEGLEEVGHGWDTQVNESLNNTVTWVAPKTKHCSASYPIPPQPNCLRPLCQWIGDYRILQSAISETWHCHDR